MMWTWLGFIHYLVGGHLGLLLLFAIMNSAGMGIYGVLLGHAFISLGCNLGMKLLDYIVTLWLMI